MAAVHSTGNFAELLWPGLAEIWGTEYEQHPKLYPEFFDIKNSDKAFEKEQQVTSFPIAAVKEEGNEAFFSRMFQGFQKEYVNLTYSIGAVVTREMYEDEQYGTIEQIPRMLAESMLHTEETVATNVLNNGHTTQQSADGVTLFSTAHTLVGGGTGSNTPATASDLTQTALENAIIDIMDFRDDQEKRLNAYATTLVVPRSLYFTASKILETEYETSSANNDVNVVSNLGIKLVTTNFLTDQDQWNLITNIKNGLVFYNRREAELDRDNDFETDNLKMKTTKRFSAGATDWRGAYSSPGA